MKQKKRGLLISLDEHPAQIIRNARTLGLNLDEQVADGTIRILFESLDKVSSTREELVTIERTLERLRSRLGQLASEYFGMITFTSQSALGCPDLSQPKLSALIFDTGVLAMVFRAFSPIQDIGMVDGVYLFS